LCISWFSFSSLVVRCDFEIQLFSLLLAHINCTKGDHCDRNRPFSLWFLSGLSPTLDPPASTSQVAGITGVYHHTWLEFIFTQMNKCCPFRGAN
jgi:hypothetical protein